MADPADQVEPRAASQAASQRTANQRTVAYEVPASGTTVDGALILGLTAAFALIGAAILSEGSILAQLRACLS